MAISDQACAACVRWGRDRNPSTFPVKPLSKPRIFTMKFQFKALAIVAALAFAAAPSFAEDIVMTGSSAETLSIDTLLSTADMALADVTTVTVNNAVIFQAEATGAVAVIDQVGATASFAMIVQQSGAGDNAIAYIQQNATTNAVAVINQR